MFAAVCVLLASLGHALMSGTSVPGWMLLLAWAGVASLAWSLAHCERGPLLVGSLTVGGQALLHGAFSLGQAVAGPGSAQRMSLPGRWAASLLGDPGRNSPSGHGSSHAMHAMHGNGMEHHADSAGMGAMPGHAHHAHHTGAAMSDPVGGMPGMAHDGMPGGTSGMIAAHVLVALLSAWWLWGGERAVFRAVRAASVRLFAPLLLVCEAVLPAPAPAVRVGWRERPRAPRKLFLSHVIWLRGPPGACAV